MNTLQTFRNICCAASTIVGVAALAGFPTGPAAALTSAYSDPFIGLVPLSSNDLAGLRGGFKVGAFDFNIGVVVSTTANSASGVYAVTTTASLNPAGHVSNARTDFSSLPPQANNGSPQTPIEPLVVSPQIVEPATQQIVEPTTPQTDPANEGAQNTPASDPVIVAAPLSVNSTELVDGGIEVSVEGAGFSIFHGISGDELLTHVQNTENGVSLSTSVDMNIAITNYSQALNNVTRNMPLFWSMGSDVGVASVQ